MADEKFSNFLTEIIDADCVDISYPAFYEELEKLTK